MADYKKYINALRKCAKEYEGNSTSTDHHQDMSLPFIISDLCHDVADLLELLLDQEPKTGHWIIEKWNNKEHYSCSSCQHVVDYEPCYHYCPYCGAKMIGSQESEE